MADEVVNNGCFDGVNERCRTCLATGGRFGVFSAVADVGEVEVSLAEMIEKCASVQISQDDGFPQRICESCKEATVRCHLFRIQCETTDRYLKSLKQNEISTKRVPSSLFEDLADDLEPIGAEETIEVVVEDHNTRPDDTDDFQNGAIESEDTNTAECCLEKETEETVPVDTLVGKNDDSSDVKKRTCPFCNKLFQYRTSMLKHQRKHTASPKTCPYCPFQPPTPSRLAKHLEQTHAHLKTFACSLCDKAFFKKCNLRLHAQTHSGVKKHTCEICGLSFVLRGNLSVHRRLHTGERPYTCGVCGRGFAQQSALRSHEAGHSDRRDHACGDCGAAFSRAGALRNHRKRHSQVREFECAICGRRFTFSSERKRHMMVHSGDKNFGCEVCGRRFSRNTNLKVHRRIHTGETPHVCGVCGKGFVQAHCLRTHAGTHGKGADGGGVG